MYRCQVCTALRGPGLTLLRHTILRPRMLKGKRIGGKEIAAEIPVCEGCHGALTSGATVQELRRKHHIPEEITAPPRDQVVAIGSQSSTVIK